MTDVIHHPETVSVITEAAELSAVRPKCDHSSTGREGWVCAKCGAELRQLSLF